MGGLNGCAVERRLMLNKSGQRVLKGTLNKRKTKWEVKHLPFWGFGVIGSITVSKTVGLGPSPRVPVKKKKARYN